jgi:hypothetical protein
MSIKKYSLTRDEKNVSEKDPEYDDEFTKQTGFNDNETIEVDDNGLVYDEEFK